MASLETSFSIIFSRKVFSHILMSMLLLNISCIDDAEDEFVPPDLLLHYSFDVNYKSTVQNLAVDRFFGTIYGGTRNDSGIIDKCIHLNEPGARIELPGLGEFVNQELSIEAWVNISNLDTLSMHKIIGDGGSGIRSFNFYIHDRRLKLILYNPGYGTHIELISGNFELQSNVWYHIAVTYNGSIAKTYINGELDNSIEHIYPIANSVNRLYMGSSGSSLNFGGYIDEFKVYGIAKSANDILASFNNTKPQY